MKVKLISSTPNLIDLIYTSARTCYNSGSPIEMWTELMYTDDIDKEKKEKFVKEIIKTGHLSTVEHSQFTFAIEGISRACSHQLVRNRIGFSYCQQSQRYVTIKEDITELYNAFLDFYSHTNYKDSKIFKILDKYFVDVQRKDINTYFYILNKYLTSVSEGMKPEDARKYLPNATKTNLILTCNLRSLITLCHKRLCTRAQKEIRMLVKNMVDEVILKEPWLEQYLQPQCETLGFCPEGNKCCGRKPTFKELGSTK